MFDKFKAMGALGALLKHRDKLREAGERIKAKAKETVAEREAGGGAVRVSANGRMELVRVELSPALMSGLQDPAQKELAEGLVVEAANEALRAAQQMMEGVVRQEAEEMGLGDFAGDIAGLLK